MLNPDPNESPSITRSLGFLAGTIIRRVGIADFINETYEAAFLPDPPQPVARPKTPLQNALDTLLQLLPVLLPILKNGTGPIVETFPGTTFPAAPVAAPAPPFTKYSEDVCAPACAPTCGAQTCGTPSDSSERTMDTIGRLALENARLGSLIDEALKHLGIDATGLCNPSTLRENLPDVVRDLVARATAGTPPSA